MALNNKEESAINDLLVSYSRITDNIFQSAYDLLKKKKYIFITKEN